jgi:hypothetical protein
MAIRMQQRRGTAEQWTLANPILAPGEVGFETDNNQFKIGDGVNQWADLQYFVNLDGISGTLSDYIPVTEKGEADGVATLDATGQIPGSQLAYVDSAIENLVGLAPEQLDTLGELATALGDNADFVTTITQDIADAQSAAEDYADGLAVNYAAASHTHGIEDLTDFQVTTPVAGQAFSYNGTKWVNTAPASSDPFPQVFMMMGA